MTQYFLREQAQADLEEIWLYTLNKWGVEQADTYLQAVLNRFFGWQNIHCWEKIEKISNRDIVVFQRACIWCFIRCHVKALQLLLLFIRVWMWQRILSEEAK